MRTCHICNKSVRSLYKHHEKFHKEISYPEFLARYLGYEKVPTCAFPGCNNICDIDYGHSKFKTVCEDHLKDSRAIAGRKNLEYYRENYPGKVSEVASRNLRNWKIKNPDKVKEVASNNGKNNIKRLIDWNEINKDEANKLHGECITRWNNAHPEELKERGRQLAKDYNKPGKLHSRNNFPTDGSPSKTQINTYNYLKKLFPNENIIFEHQVGIYSIDIYFADRNLGIEVDGDIFHKNFYKDILRDQYLYNEIGCKIRRLDTHYLDNKVSDSDLVTMILLETKIQDPYWIRIPYSEIVDWKWDVRKVGAKLQLTYEVTNEAD